MTRPLHHLLDADQITKNMRYSKTGVRSVIAKTHHPYAKSRYGNHLHRVCGVRVDYVTEYRFNLLAVYECGEASQHPVFWRRRPPQRYGFHLCARCFPEPK